MRKISFEDAAGCGTIDCLLDEIAPCTATVQASVPAEVWKLRLAAFGSALSAVACAGCFDHPFWPADAIASSFHVVTRTIAMNADLARQKENFATISLFDCRIEIGGCPWAPTPGKSDQFKC